MTRFDLAHWDLYNADQVGRAPRQLCRDLLARAGEGAGRQAVDLGAGSGVEAAALVRAGWRVLAVDPAPATADLVPRQVPPALRAGLQVRVAAVQDVFPLPGAHLVHASYALPFVPPSQFARVWDGVRAALAPGGWLGVTLFGERDGWATDPAMADVLTFHPWAEVDRLLDGLDVLVVDEREHDGPAFGGTKHWHTFEVVARRLR
ncbi:methyltransferase family protein [Isoptericola sp. CG 20/1183]|uniref:Methyltransferase family protein n=1 Tax=Isoptericola halotolerans TaxID=300560 RepID=A0ABX5E991_9MICO|nr:MULTISPECIES: class I SAM-dependent methyltransferase [Isoptericola]PRZ02632.1 methyltransferase family protein [Isoptericola sp. CG 20/1183]PRZ02984.1 methyltransferase family protein [Isoptericola halotolerans]